MSDFNPLVPTGDVNLDVDYQALQKNNAQLDTTFGIDHYKFSDQTLSNGFHNKFTSPAYQSPFNTIKSTPPPTSANPVLYGFQPLTADNGTATTNLGVLQYSRGPSNAVPTPLTSIHSSSTPISILPRAVVNIFDFTGIPIVFFRFYVMNTGGAGGFLINECTGWWSGSSLKLNVFNNSGTNSITISSSGATLIIQNANPVSPGSPTFSQVYWTLEFQRVS